MHFIATLISCLLQQQLAQQQHGDCLMLRRAAGIAAMLTALAALHVQTNKLHCAYQCDNMQIAHCTEQLVLPGANPNPNTCVHVCAGQALITAQWPTKAGAVDSDAVQQFEALQAVVRSIRNARAEYGVELGRKIPATICVEADSTRYNWMPALVLRFPATLLLSQHHDCKAHLCRIAHT